MIGPAACAPSATKAPSGTHASAVYADDEAWAEHVTGFLREGLDRNEQVCYVVDRTRPDHVIDMLSHHGIDAHGARDLGRLTLVSAQEGYLPTGTFDPDARIRQWHTAVTSARQQGFDGLRTVGEMSWIARDVPVLRSLLEYELRAHREVFDRLPLAALCLYDRRLVDDHDIAVLHGAHLNQQGSPGPGAAALRVAPLPDRAGLRMAGDMNHDTREESRGAAAALTRLCATGGELDLSGLEYLDSAGAADLVAAVRRSPQGHLVVLDPPPALLRLMDLFPELRPALEVVAR